MFFGTLCSTSRQFSIFLNLLFIFFPTGYCVIPQANQEDVLRSFKSYSDVTMFHFTIPKEVPRATWHFAAFMDDPTCHTRKVYIHLKFGSYPIITANNGISVSTKYDRDIVVTTIATYQPKNVTIVPVYEPQPGDWFIAAYMSYWDEKVQQQGLGHKCRYSIGTIALWSQIDNILNIPLNYRIKSRTSATTTYYKIYIPSGTSSFRLTIWNCSFTLHNFRDVRIEPCIEAMYLKGRVLPTSDHFHSMESKTLTTNASYSFVEFSPYEDSYYYLLIVSNSIIEFNVKVDATECPIVGLTEKSFTRRYTDVSLNSNSITETNTYKELIKHRWDYDGENDASGFYDRDEFYSMSEKHETNNRCISRHRLVRVKHAETFSTVYLPEGKEWSNSRLILIDSIPMMTQFDILPLIDIGGTLDIDVQLEVKELPSTPTLLVLVTMCIQRDRIPKLKDRRSCQNGTLIPINLSSLNKRDASLSIAYPQPGTWYIIILATCYNYGKPVRCRIEEMSILLNIRTKKCMFPEQNPCGDHGICREIQKNILHYATCDCFKGYTGWDCTDISNTVSAISLMSTILLVTSNIFFIPAIYIAVKRKLYAEGLVYLITMLFSSLYHACDENGRFCITKYEILQYIDFFSSILAFWVTLVAIAELPIIFVPLCHMIGVFIVTFGVQINRMCLISILIPLSLGIVIPVFTRTYRIFQSRKCKKPSRKILLGLLFAITGLLLYSFIETEKNYQYVHSAWHIAMAISLIFLLPPAKLNRQTTSSTINASFNDDSESWNCKEFHGIPTFTIIDRENGTFASN